MRAVRELTSGRPARVALVSSSGGHVDLLMRLRPVLEGFERTWITQPSERSQALVTAGERFLPLPVYHRNPVQARVATNLVRSVRYATERPDLVLTSGSGLTVPYCLAARALGVRLMFIETSARVTGPSASGRVLGRIAHHVVAQWPSMAEVYPGATICRSSIVERIRPGAVEPGDGTFVGVGTHTYGFDRLLKMVDDAVERGVLPRPVVAQTGSSSYRPRHYAARDWLRPHEVDAAVAAARYVVCHAGSGLLSTALSTGRRPLVLARRGALREHFDDHQEQLVAELGGHRVLVPLDDRIDVGHLAAADEPLVVPAEYAAAPALEDVVGEELARLRREGQPA